MKHSVVAPRNGRGTWIEVKSSNPLVPDYRLDSRFFLLLTESKDSYHKKDFLVQ